jgi:hypothetical protein
VDYGRISAAPRQVSPERIRTNIEKLASFGTKAELERYSKDCGGCLEVKTDAFTDRPPTEFPTGSGIMRFYGEPRPARNGSTWKKLLPLLASR